MRVLGAAVAAPFLLFGLFLLLRGDPGDGFQGPLIVGGISVALGLVILASTVRPRRCRSAGLVALVILAALPLYRDLAGIPGLAVNVVFAGLALLAAMRLPRDAR